MDLLYYLGVFAKAYAVQLRNSLLKSRAAAWGVLTLVVFLPLGGAFVVRLAYGLTSAALRVPPLAALLPAVPGGLVGLLLLTTLLNGTTGALQSVFLATDLEPLLATPAPLRAIFLARLLEGLLVQVALEAAFGTALLAGYGLALGYGAAYFVVLPLLLALIAGLPTGLGAIIALLLIRVAPARFTRDFVNVTNILLGVAAVALMQLLPRAGGQTVPLLSALNNPLLPSTWTGQALVAIGEGRWAAALPASLAVVALSLAVFACSVVLVEQQAAGGIAELAATRSSRRRPAARTATAAPAAHGLKPRPIALVILRKELRTYPRDTANLQPLFSSLLLGGSWLWGTFHAGAGMFADVGGNVLIALSVASLVAYHPGLGAISREGPGLWQLQSAPVSGADVALGKLAFAYLPYLVVGVPFLLVAGLAARLDLASLGVGALTVALLGWGCAALLVNLAFRLPRLEWKTTSQQVNTVAWFLALPCVGLYVLIGVPLLLIYRGVPPGPGQAVTFLICTAVASLATWLLHRETLHTATRRLPAIEG